MSPNNLTQGHLVKRECLAADITPVGSLDRAKCPILGVAVAERVFGESRSFWWSGSHFVVLDPPLEL